MLDISAVASCSCWRQVSSCRRAGAAVSIADGTPLPHSTVWRAPWSELPLPQRDTTKDSYLEQSDQATTTCSWPGTYELNGKRYWDFWPHAYVAWTLKRTLGTSGNATQLQRKDFTNQAAKGRRETSLGFGDEAYWGPPKPNQTTCSLAVRDGNLILYVSLYGAEHPAATCESEAKKIARAALAAMPR